MRRWRVVDTVYGKVPVPEIELRCPFCGSKLLLHQFFVQETGFLHVDIYMKCINCDWYTVFGVPITREEYNQLRQSPLHGKTINKEVALAIMSALDYTPEEIKKVEERIRALGYW